MFSIPIQTAIVNSIVGNLVLAGIFLYLWRLERGEGALGFWAMAYAASACRVAFRLVGLEGYAWAIYGEAVFGTAAVVLLWMGTRVFVGKPFASPWKAGLAAAAGMGGVSVLAALGIVPLVVPYLIGGAVFFMVGLALLLRGREHPGVGYSLSGFLFALYGGYVFVFSELAASAADARSYVFGPIINLAIGMVLLVVTQRKQQFAARALGEALQREAAGRRSAEDVVLQSEQRYRAIIDTTRSLIGLLQPDGTLIDINRTALEQAGAQRQEVIGKPFWETPWWTHDAEQQQRLRQAIRRVAAGGHDRFEATYPAADGGLGYFNFFLTPIRDAAGQVAFLVPEAHDISARRHIEQTLHMAEQRFRAISEGSMLGVFATDERANGSYFSRRATDITGISEAEVIAGRTLDHVHAEDKAQHRAQWRAAIHERKPFVGEFRFIRRDGSITWCRIHAAPIMEEDILLGFVGTVEDINARKAAERALRDSEERFSSFFALSPEPFAVARYPAGEYIQVNDAWERTFGYRQEEVVGRSALDLGLWEKPEDRSRIYEDIVRRNQARSGEIRMRNKSGAEILVQISARVVAVGQSKYILWGTHDVTERRRMEQALRLSEERVSRVFYLLPDLVTISSLDEGRFVDMNHHWEPMMGYSREEALGRPTADLGIWVHPEQRRRLVADILRDGVVRNREITTRRKDGREIICETSGSTFDWQGQRLLLLVTRDVTAQRLIEQARIAAERNLRESEEKFSKFFALGPEPLAVVRYEDATYVDVNEAWLRKFGYRREEVVGRTPQQLDFWVDFEERRKAIEALEEGGGIKGLEAWYRTREGKHILADVSATVFELSGKRHVLWDLHDITEKRQAEAMLRQSEEMFSTIFHELPAAVAVTTATDGRFIDVNPAWLDLFGYARDEVIGRTSREIDLWVDYRDRDRLFQHVRQNRLFQRREIAFRAKDGRAMLTEFSGRVFSIGGEEALIAATLDITERKRIEEALRESEEKFSTIFHRSPVALGVTSIPEGQYLDVNAAWEVQFGFDRGQMLGRTSLDIGLWADAEERRRLFEDLEKATNIQNREVHFMRGDGAPILCELSGQVFVLNNRKVFLWGAHDVTEHRRAQREIEELNLRLEARVRERTVRLEKANAELEEALESLKLAQDELVHAEKLAALGSLVAGVAHELNTPIGNSVTVASTLQDKTREFEAVVASGQVRRSSLDGYMEGARTACDLLLRSLSQASELVGSFKQVAVDQTSAQRRRFDLRMVVEEVAATLAPMLKKTPFKLDLDLADKLSMDSYPGSLGQVITNLVTNSLAHAFEGRKQGVMRLRTWRRGPRQVGIEFLDDGVGIPEQDLKRVFDPFFTTKLGRGGSGLGLHIVYNLVTRVLGGRVAVSSQPESGTRFEFVLPIKAPESGGREA